MKKTKTLYTRELKEHQKGPSLSFRVTLTLCCTSTCASKSPAPTGGHWHTFNRKMFSMLFQWQSELQSQGGFLLLLLCSLSSNTDLENITDLKEPHRLHINITSHN